MYEDFEIILSDSETLHIGWKDRGLLSELIENFQDCLDCDGRFRINGTKYFWVDTIRPGTVKRIDEHETWHYFDGLYRMKAYGGYEWGGRGCFYEEVPTPCLTPESAPRHSGGLKKSRKCKKAVVRMELARDVSVCFGVQCLECRR